MTNAAEAIENAYRALSDAQDAYDAPCLEARTARAAYRRSRSKKNLARLVEAEAACDAALEICDAAHEAVAKAQDEAEAAEARAEAEAAAAEQPSLF